MGQCCLQKNENDNNNPKILKFLASKETQTFENDTVESLNQLESVEISKNLIYN